MVLFHSKMDLSGMMNSFHCLANESPNLPNLSFPKGGLNVTFTRSDDPFWIFGLESCILIEALSVETIYQQRTTISVTLFIGIIVVCRDACIS